MFSINGLNMKKLTGVLLSLMVASNAMAKSESPILLIGASYGDASTPFNDALQAPQGGGSVGSGSFLSLGNALVRNHSLSGHLINEAQAGATTFDRLFCRDVCFPGVLWQGYDTQFTKALARVTQRQPDGSIGYNAEYVVIVGYNDCSHSGSMGIPHAETSPCTLVDINQHVDRLITLGERILSYGLTPIFLNPPAFEDLDYQALGDAAGLLWVIDNDTHDLMQDVRHSRISLELPEAVQLGVWEHFEHRGDGIHPTDKTTTKAAQIIATYIHSQAGGN